MSKQTFSLKADDVKRLQDNIIAFGKQAPEAINDWLANPGADILTDSITNFMPQSKRKKKHAKDSKWEKRTTSGMSLTVETAPDFWYLCFPLYGIGHSKNKGANDFLGKGFDAASDDFIDGLMGAVTKEWS